MTPTEGGGRLQKVKLIPGKTRACRKRGGKKGNYNVDYFSCKKIFKNSLYRRLFSLIYTLIYGKKHKNICINSYVCHVYISIDHFKSFVWQKKKKKRKKRHRANKKKRVPVTPLLHN